MPQDQEDEDAFVGKVDITDPDHFQKIFFPKTKLTEDYVILADFLQKEKDKTQGY